MKIYMIQNWQNQELIIKVHLIELDNNFKDY